MKYRVAVIGAGPMGLATAYQLIKDGHTPIVFEGDDRVGGMTATFDFSGQSIERYYHFHCTSDRDFILVLNELGIADQLQWTKTKMGYWYQDRLQSWGNPLALLKFKGLSLQAKFRYGLHAFACTKRKNWAPLDHVEATGWIRRWVGEEAYDVLWRRLFDFKFYNYKDNLSAAWIWSRIRRIGTSRYNIFEEKLGYLNGGSDTLLNALKDFIEKNGGEIRLSTPVDKVVVEQGRVQGIQSNNKTESFDKIISTIPLPLVPKIIPDLPSSVLDQYKNLKNIAVVCVIVKLKKQVSENFWLNTNDQEMDIPGLVEYTNLRKLKNHIVYVPFYMPREHETFQEPNQNFISKVKSYLKKINPSLVDEDFLDVKASRYQYAQPICDPGYLDNLPPAKSSIQGLWVADTSHYYPEDRGISESIGFGRKLAKDATH
ncbi:NAD(P)/FAD-dependent oxidoreductase [Pseudomonas sp. ADAK2]|uniref:NAD(P)/FAD-dependent oxidoreductase n=1 Tax=unclassified Pseudomonas TaxID=196821 RepID=UPI00146341E5|nr:MULTISPECIES: NAD(P)/FAD-dependent oxidoreductase [unclassified Pseudomonas]QJI44959.1 NAD(P)/FAD-dependent oxidoreductase [Pseudomonas sp. ADAK7]QJI51260.1 NAD(P)/FAD-dependent oxidoreductase [Pseudomonas sp. ADAK2]